MSFIRGGGNDIICPVCYDTFKYNEALFVDSRDLQQRDYPQLKRSRSYFFHENINLANYPLIFNKTDDKTNWFSAISPNGNTTFMRACPNCYNYLPGASGHMPTFVVPVFGSDKAQKSSYLAALLHNLNVYLSDNYDATIVPADFDTAQSVFREYEYPLYGELTAPDPRERTRPLIYKFCRNNTVEQTTIINKKTGDYIINQALIMFFDVNMSTVNEYPEYFARGLSQANGMLFLVDSPKISVNDGDLTFVDPWLGFFTENMVTYFGNKFSCPASVILSDLSSCGDATLRRWSRISANADKQEHLTKDFPMKKMQQNSNVISKAMKKDFITALNTVRNIFEMDKVMFFAYNSWTDDAGKVRADVVSSVPVETPLLYLMAKFKLIKTKTGLF